MANSVKEIQRLINELIWEYARQLLELKISFEISVNEKSKEAQITLKYKGDYVFVYEGQLSSYAKLEEAIQKIIVDRTSIKMDYQIEKETLDNPVLLVEDPFQYNQNQKP